MRAAKRPTRHARPRQTTKRKRPTSPTPQTLSPTILVIRRAIRAYRRKPGDVSFGEVLKAFIPIKAKVMGTLSVMGFHPTDAQYTHAVWQYLCKCSRLPDCITAVKKYLALRLRGEVLDDVRATSRFKRDTEAAASGRNFSAADNTPELRDQVEWAMSRVMRKDRPIAMLQAQGIPACVIAFAYGYKAPDWIYKRLKRYAASTTRYSH